MNNRRAIAIFFLSLFFLIPLVSVKAASCVCITGDECTSISADMSSCDIECTGSGYEGSTWGDCTTDTGETSGSSTSSTSSETSTTSRIWNLITGKSSDNYTTPILSINIPTVSFSKTISEGGYLKSNFIGEYVSGFYKYLLAISGIIAVLLFMVGGLQYVISPGGEEVGAAKKRITGALTGMVLLFCVYLILYTVNPKLTSFDTLSLQIIPPIDLTFEDEEISGTVATSFGTASGNKITGSGAKKIPTNLVSLVEAAAASLPSGISMRIADGYRTPEGQIAQIKKNCTDPTKYKTCNPPTCILKNNNPASCPHTTGKALDIWGCDASGCLSRKSCPTIATMSKCINDPRQAAVIKALKAQGFCLLKEEAWHFENPPMSSTCQK